MQRLFVELTPFRQKIDSINIKNLEKDIKDEILKDPARGDLIIGTGGLRKIRVFDTKSKRGKSGSFRVIYLDLEDV